MRSQRRSPRLPEVWGGLECTVNRVRDEFFDQLDASGHDERLEDLELFAELGISALRYPVLWERTAPDGVARADWRWADERLARLRELGIRPIVGLVHHGSGPRSTSLVDPEFPEKLAAYARAVAERYPWVSMWTPVNEPLTTARFSGLYGHWYPHGRDDATFARCLLAQCRATVLAMRAIREVIPDAQLVQTEDLGKTWSTRTLAYQAEFENERRFATFDLLSGQMTADKLFRQWLLRDVGVELDALEWFVDNPWPPDVVGVNHYLSSERFLDERVERYPEHERGGNGKDAYADVLAARVRSEGAAGPYVLLREVWERYGLPVAVTEAHNGCTREEQLRWLEEVWDAATQLRAEGADVRAVTVWSLLGAFGWDKLLCDGRRYEPGVYDISAGRPRATALAGMARSLAERGSHEHPVLGTPGWWRRPERLFYPPVSTRGGVAPDRPARPAPPLLVTGARGTLGQAVARACEARGLPYRLMTRHQLDIADAESAAFALETVRPWAIVNAAGYVRVDDAEDDADRCFRENAAGPAVLAEACASHGIPLVTFSSDLVFNGRRRRPYVESDSPSPLSVYGRSKADGERLVLERLASALVVRTSAFFGPWDEWNFVTLALQAIERGETFFAADDAVVSPTYVPDLVDATLDLLIDGECGVWHVANDGALTWAELARAAAEGAGLDAGLVIGVPTADLALRAPRPRYSALASERGRLLRPLEEGLDGYLRERATRPADPVGACR